MLIAQLETPSPVLQGDQIYRTVQPCRALARLPQTAVVSGPWLSQAMQQAAQVADVLIICQCIEVDFLPLVQQRQQAGRVTVFEINDQFLALPAGVPGAATYANPLVRSLGLQLARKAHGLQLATPALEQTFGHLHGKRRVLPNALWEVPAVAPRAAGPLRLGWGGSLTHHDDVRQIIPVVADLLAANPEVHWLAVAPRAMHGLFAALPQQRCHIAAPMDLPAYLRCMATLDIGLAPLEPSEFNRCRSDLKFLEYAQLGVCAVCSDAGPYNATVAHGINGLLYHDGAGLRRSVQELIDTPETARRLAAAGHAYVAEHRLEQPWAPVRRAFYEELGARSRADGLLRLRALVGESPVDWPEPGYARLRLTEAEAETYRGLLLPTGSPEALAALNAGARASPSNYMPWLYLAIAETDPRRALAALGQAAQLCPESAHIPYCMAERLLQLQQIEPAITALRRTLRQAGDFAPAHDALARIAQHLGDTAATLQHQQAAQRANPDFTAA